MIKTFQWEHSAKKEKAYQRAYVLLKEAQFQGAAQDEPTGDVLRYINHLDEQEKKYSKGEPRSNFLRDAFNMAKASK